MRIIKGLLILAFALAPAAAIAQTNPSTSDTPAVTSGWIDFGARSTSSTGQAARYERFRDLGDGLFLEAFRFKTETNGWNINLLADHAGRRDQRYTGYFVRPGKLKANASWDQIPFLMSQTTKTPYVQTTPGVFRLDDAVQLKLQNLLPTTLRYPEFTALVASSPEFDLKSRRYSAGGGFEYFLSEAASLKVNMKQSTRKGNQPYGAYLSTEIELPVPIDNKLTDVDASVEATRGVALFRVGYTGSWFVNNTGTIVFDNPARLADKTDTANTSSQGRLPALAPDSTRLGVNGMVSIKMPRRSRLTAYAMMASLKDGGQSVIPFTINTGVASPALYRSTVNGEARTTAANVTFTSRPSKMVNVNVRYRYFDFNNRTPLWTNTSRVSNDGGSVNTTSTFVTEPYALKRNTLDADVYLTPKTRGALSVGATRSDESRNDRIFSKVVDNIGRVKFDLTGGGPLNVRSVYEHSQRRGQGLDEAMLLAISEKAAMRHFDISDRNRDRFFVLGSFMPVTNWTVNMSTAVGRDNYLNSGLGLRDNNHNVYTAGFTGSPSDKVNLGLSYSFEDYHTKQMNNNASAAAGVDLSRNFSTNGDDKVHSVIGNFDVIGIADKIDLHVMYDFNQTRATYTYGFGDPIATTLPAPVPLPQIRSDLTRASVDGIYHVNRRVSLGVTYWYDKFATSDFTLDSQAQAARVPGNYMLLGYAYEPYTAHTIWGRAIVHF